MIDTSPTLGLLNQVIFLGVDYFLTPMMPDAFSVQGVENLGNTFTEWKDMWKKTAKPLARDRGISSKNLLDGEGLFIGYIINSYNQYGKQPIKMNKGWIAKIPEYVRRYLSEKHCRNGLVASTQVPLGLIKDYGQLPPIGQEKNKAIFDLVPALDGFENVKGTQENLEQSKKEFDVLVANILQVMSSY